MSRPAKTLEKVLRGTFDANIGLLRHLGLDERIKGSHHVFTREASSKSLICSREDRRQSHTKYVRFER